MNDLQKKTVKEVYRLVDENPILVKMTDEFNQVINNFAHHAEIGGIFVIDDDHRFSGVITRTDLLDWARVKLGAVFLEPMTNMDKTIRLAYLIKATTIGDVLRQDTKKAFVLTDDTLAQALRLMIETDLILLPVIDESQQIIGSLALSELLNKVLT